MKRLRIGIRWWLALAFALIAAVTALAVASVFSNRSGEAFRGRAQELVAGSAFVAAQDISLAQALGKPRLAVAVAQSAQLHKLSLFVFNTKRQLVSPARSRGISIKEVPFSPKELRRVIDQADQFVHPWKSGNFVVGLALTSGALIAVGTSPTLRAELGIVHSNIIEAALIAIGIGALVGLVIATLISVRLRRIRNIAAEIERGNFQTRLEPKFRDEVGDLALSVDRMRERLRDSFARVEFERDRLLRLLERLHEGVVMVDRALVVQFANSEAARVLGVVLTEGDPLPEPWPGFSFEDFARRLFDRDATVQQVRVSPDDDEDRICIVLGVPGNVAEPALLVVTDATEQERRELAEREFVANASHELRTPLTTILGAVEALQMGGKEEPATRDRFLGLIEREAGRLARLARALLVLARAQTREELPQRDSILLRPLLEEVAGQVETQPNVEVEVHCDASIAALGDRDLAEQALRNLVENAASHTREGRIVLSAVRDNGTVQIAVQDTGTGLPAAEHERVFDRFYRAGSRNADGFGLGLAIVRQAVRVLGGGIELESAPRLGTRVTITLPADERTELGEDPAR